MKRPITKTAEDIYAYMQSLDIEDDRKRLVFSAIAEILEREL